MIDETSVENVRFSVDENTNEKKKKSKKQKKKNICPLV